MHERLRTRIEEVTSRQLEVARLVAEGRTNPEIASELGITLDGAKYHVSELLGRLGLERREEIAEWYRSERRGQRVRRFSALFASAPRAFATAATVTAVVALGVMFAVGLSGGRVEDPLAGASLTPTQTPTSFVSELGTHPPAGALGNASDSPPSLDGLPDILRQRLHSELPEIVSWERVDWTNGCFDLVVARGCPISVSPVPGYRVIMELRGEEYIARTDLNVARYALEAAPPIDPLLPATAVYRWEGSTDLYCLEVEVADHGRGWVAGCGQAPTPFNLAQSVAGGSGFMEHLAQFQPFDVFEPSSVVRFVGTGDIVASGLDQRAALEWGHHLAIESYTGESSASMALAIGWRDDNAEGCTEVQFMRYGAAYLSGCPEGGNGVVFLNDAQLQQLYAWIDSYRPFEVPGDETYLTFAGAGDEVASEAVQAEIREWLQSPPWAPATSVE